MASISISLNVKNCVPYRPGLLYYKKNCSNAAVSHTVVFEPRTLEFPGAPKFRKWSTTFEIKNDEETLPSGEPFVPNEDENGKYKKSLFLH